MKISLVRSLIVAIGVSAVVTVPCLAQTIHNVPPGGDLQAALNAAHAGDTVTLAPGEVYTGNFVLPAKGGGAYITLRSATPDHLLPGQGMRIDPRYSPALAKLRSPNGAPAIATAPGASHYRLLFLEILPSAAGSGALIALGDGSSRQSSLASVPHSLIVDRVYAHGSPDAPQRRGIALNSAHTEIVNSWISDIKAAGQDSQAIGGWNGPGPYLIANNYLEGAGENIMFGGADPAIPGLIPADITIVGNHVTKPLAWRGGPWTVKNLLELKSAQRVVIDGNLFEHNWAAAQAGYAILLKSVNQDGAAPWSVVQHIQFINNVVRDVSSAINILGRDTRHAAMDANDITIRNNLFANVSGAAFGGAGRLLLVNGGSQITLDHNTAIVDGASAIFADGPVQGFSFTNNVMFDNGAGIKGNGAGAGTATIARFFPGAYVAGNVIAGANAALYPPMNHYPASSDIGFSDWANGHYRLSPSSAFRGAATDGGDPGASFDHLPGAGIVPPHGPMPRSINASAPPAPQGLSARVTGSTVTLTWRAASEASVTTYLLEAGTAPGATNVARTSTGNRSTTLVATSVPDGVYYVRVRAVNGASTSSASNEIAVNVGAANECAGAPSAPSALTARVQGLTVQLSWSPPSSGCAPTHYVLQAGSARGLSNLATAIVRNHSLTARAPAGTYYVRIVGVNAAGTSVASNEVIVTLR